MSRIERSVQAPGHDRSISQPMLPCSRCQANIEYDLGQEWRVVHERVNEHWKACPGKPHARPVHMARTPVSPHDMEIALPSPVAPEQQQHSNSSLVAETGSPNSSPNPWISLGCERKRRTLEQRKLELEQDEYAENVTTKSVVCGGCRKEISLDKRSKYYPGLWLKHRGKCPGIEKLERAKGKVPQALEGKRPILCESAGVTSESEDNNRDTLQLGRAERSPYGHGVAATHHAVGHHELEDRFGDNEDEDEDLVPQESFPTLNCAFYWSQRRQNRSKEWTYRYATNDEITTNFFRGQDELYARPSGRSFNQPTPESGGHCEAAHFVKDQPNKQQFHCPRS